MGPVTFQHGPVTITVDGLPETIRPEQVTLHLGIHTLYGATYGQQRETFAATFAALGGSATFPAADPSRKHSIRSEAIGGTPGAFCDVTLILYPPDPPGAAPGEYNEAIQHVLAAEEERRRLAGLVDAARAKICEVDPQAYGGYVTDAAIRIVAANAGMSWRDVLTAWRASRPSNSKRVWGLPPGAERLNAEAQKLVERLRNGAEGGP